MNSGGARFSGFFIDELGIDSIEPKDISVIYSGYQEISDRDLGFDNPADSLYKIIDFEIRFAFTTDSLITYSFAKDIGLINVTHFYRDNGMQKREMKLYNAEVNGRSFTRLGLYVYNEKQQEIPQKISIQAFPNPFNPTTTIRYELPNSGEVTVQVFDGLGRKVQTLQNGYKTFGAHTIAFNASELSSGLYLVRVQSKDDVQTTKVVLIK